MKNLNGFVVTVFSLLISFQAIGGEPDMPTAEEVIQALDLKPLPEEGGYYRETFRGGDGNIEAKTFGIKSESKRHVSTAIYYLVTPDSFSALHRVKSDEIFHFYAGDSAEMLQITPDGKPSRHVIGSNVFANESPQVVVPKGHWQGLKLKDGGKWALMGTTVAPGFEFEDFEVGFREDLIKEFPDLREEITEYTRENQQ